LADTSSHIPATSVYSEGGESVRLQDDSLFCQAYISMPEVSNRQGGDNKPLPVALVAGTYPFLDLAFMKHIMSNRNGSGSLKYDS